MMSLPQIAQLEFEVNTDESLTQTTVHKTFDWDFEQGDFRLKNGQLVEVEGIDYIKIWVKKALFTVTNSLIYEGINYGSEHQTLIGRNFNPAFMKAELERMIREALFQNDAITDVNNFTFNQDGSWLIIGFTVNSIYGTTEQEVTV